MGWRKKLYIGGAYAFAVAYLLTAGISPVGAQPLNSIASRAQSAPDLTPVKVANPFKTQKAIDAFQDYIARLSLKTGQSIEIPSDFWNAAPSIDSWGYEFAANDINTVDVIFEQIFDVKGIIESYVAAIGALKEDGCSFFSAENPRITMYSQDTIVASAGLSGKKRACWGDFKTDLGSIGGHATAVFHFRPDLDTGPGRYKGRIRPDNPRINIDAEVQDIFGINVNSVIGQILNSVERIAVGAALMGTNFWVLAPINDFDAFQYRVQGNSHIDSDYVLQDDGRIDAARYRDFISQIHQVTWALQPNFLLDGTRSGFFGTIDAPKFKIAYRARLKPQFPYESIRQDIITEIEIIKSFSDDPTTLVVLPNSSLWKISTERYRNGFYYNMLAEANGIPNSKLNRLKVGQSIVLPPTHKLAPVNSVHFLVPGETFYSICKQNRRMPLSNCLKLASELNVKTNISRISALQRVRIPQCSDLGATCTSAP